MSLTDDMISFYKYSNQILSMALTHRVPLSFLKLQKSRQGKADMVHTGCLWAASRSIFPVSYRDCKSHHFPLEAHTMFILPTVVQDEGPSVLGLCFCLNESNWLSCRCQGCDWDWEHRGADSCAGAKQMPNSILR